MKKYAKEDGGVNVPGCKGHDFLKVPQDGWMDFQEDFVTTGGVTAEEWLHGMREEWGWRVLIAESE